MTRREGGRASRFPRELSGRRHVCRDDRQPHGECKDHRAQVPASSGEHCRVAGVDEFRRSAPRETNPRGSGCAVPCGRGVYRATDARVWRSPARSRASGSETELKAARKGTTSLYAQTRRSSETRSWFAADRARSSPRSGVGLSDRRQCTNLRDDGDLRLAIRELRARLCHCPVVVCDQEVGSTCQQPGAPVLEAIDDSCGEQLLDRPHDPVAKEPGRGQAGCGKGELRAREDVCF